MLDFILFCESSSFGILIGMPCSLWEIEFGSLEFGVWLFGLLPSDASDLAGVSSGGLVVNLGQVPPTGEAFLPSSQFSLPVWPREVWFFLAELCPPGSKDSNS